MESRVVRDQQAMVRLLEAVQRRQLSAHDWFVLEEVVNAALAYCRSMCDAGYGFHGPNCVADGVAGCYEGGEG